MNMNDHDKVDVELAWAIRHYVMDSGRLLMLVVDSRGGILEANSTFRSRFSAFDHVRGESVWNFLVCENEIPQFLGRLPPRVPVSQVMHDRDGSKSYLFSMYQLEEDVLMIGELMQGAETEIIERMSHLSNMMVRLVRDMGLSNRKLRESNEKNLKLSRIDPLTGLANRRYFLERFQRVFNHARLHEQGLAFLIIDLDHFKQTNDTYGHAGGDKTLIAVSDLLCRILRVGDMAGRWGGEEFVAFLPETGLSQAKIVAERIREGVAELRPLDPNYGITGSIGLVTLDDHEHPEQLVRAADTHLYHAKATGRNRVVARVA
jgi:diguanylate cyclase (GGDEF)-like protein